MEAGNKSGNLERAAAAGTASFDSETTQNSSRSRIDQEKGQPAAPDPSGADPEERKAFATASPREDQYLNGPGQGAQDTFPKISNVR